LLLRLSGSLLLRYVERQLSALLFHEPPRKTREDPAASAVRPLFPGAQQTPQLIRTF
jgi:hypothetical protein